MQALHSASSRDGYGAAFGTAAGYTAHPNTSAVLSGTAKTIVWTAGPNPGTYRFRPAFAVMIPANAYRSNYTGTVSDSPLNPYVTTITVTSG